MIPCPEQEHLQRFIAGLLPVEQSSQVESHLSRCEKCTQFIDTIADSGSKTLADPHADGADKSLLNDDSFFSRSSWAGDHPPRPKHQDSSLVGRQVGNFVVQRVIGEGGMGIVYEAIDKSLDRGVAIKAMRNTLLVKPIAVERFRREARLVASIDHPNVVPIFQTGEFEGSPYLVMPRLTGQSLQQYITEHGPLPESEALQIALDVVAGLRAAHSKGLVHRDIKPDNIWLDKTNGTARILDFGLAAFHVENADLTKPGTLLGTPRYMSPEQASGQRIDHRSDLFSLGSVLYRMLAGVPAFESEAGIPTLLHSIVHEHPQPISAGKPTVSKCAVDIVEKLLQKEPADRPRDADEVWIQIRNCLNHSAKVVSGTGRGRSVKGWLCAVGMLAIVVLLMLAQVVLKIRTENGTVMVKFKGADTPLAVDVSKDGTIVLEDPRGGESLRITVNRNTNSMTIEKQGFSAETKSFAINGPDGREVTVELVPLGPTERISQRGADQLTTGLIPQSRFDSWDSIPDPMPLKLCIPFSESEAAEGQKQWAEFLRVPVRWTDSHGIEFVLVPPGEYEQGMAPKESADLISLDKTTGWWEEMCKQSTPKRKAIVDRPFYLSACEITQGQFEELTTRNPSFHSEAGSGKELAKWYENKHLPVESVTWLDAIHFCNELSSDQSLPGCYVRRFGHVERTNGLGYRLPTDAEWEWACRAGTAERAYFEPLQIRIDDYAWTNSSTTLPRAVGQLMANNFGLHDMLGNVSEWCWDQYRGFDDRALLTTHHRIVRGFHFGDSAEIVHAGFRSNSPIDLRWKQVGIRLALDIPYRQSLESQNVLTKRRSFSELKEAAASNENSISDPKLPRTPFSSVAAKQYQISEAIRCDVPVQWTNSIGIHFALIPPGIFSMGLDDETQQMLVDLVGDDQQQIKAIESCGPLHEVTISRPFYLSTHEITHEQFFRLMQKNPSSYTETSEYRESLSRHNTEHRPIDGVTWPETIRFCNKLSEEERIEPHYSKTVTDVQTNSATGYRLPSGAEWEWACRAGTIDLRHFTAEESKYIGYYSWCAGTSTFPRMVCQLAPNGFGLFDMYGNVAEWVEDCHQDTPYPTLPQIDPVGPKFSGRRRTKGNTLYRNETFCLSGYHGHGPIDYRYKEVGFRIAISIATDDPAVD